jgi:hypothetical protein
VDFLAMSALAWISAPFHIIILSINFMETGINSHETPDNLNYPLDLHLALRRAKRGDISFEELRSLFVNWAKNELQSMETQVSKRGEPFDPVNPETD